MNSVTIEVLIAMAAGYFLLAFVLSAIIEILAAAGRWRADHLRDMLGDFFGNRRLLRAFYADPVIRTLFSTRGKRLKPQAPSAIRPKTFAETVVRILFSPKPNDPQSQELTRNHVTKRLEELSENGTGEFQPLVSRLRLCSDRARTRQTVADEKYGAAFIVELANLFTEQLDRLKGRYRRKVMQWSIIIGFALSLALNFDSIRIATELYENAGQRDALVSSAVTLVEEEDSPPLQPDDKIIKNGDMEQKDAEGGFVEVSKDFYKLALGWDPPPSFLTEWSLSGFAAFFLGVLISTFALSLGAPFWYDLLGKLVSLRSGGKEESNDAGDDKKDSGLAVSNNGNPPKKAIYMEKPPPIWEVTDRVLSGLRKETTDSMSYSTALALAGLSRRVYDKPCGPKISSQMKNDGWELKLLGAPEKSALEVEGVRRKELRFVADTQVYLYKNKKTKVAVFAFRGTEPSKLSDIWTDLKVDRRRAEGELGEVHRGFLGALDARVKFDGPGKKTLPLQMILDREYRALAKDGVDDYSVWFTGHSLGGALAHLYTARHFATVRENDRSPFRGCYTFGCPRVGNGKFARASQRLSKNRIYRFVNDLDIVPRLPAAGLLGNRHSRTVIYFDRLGNAQEQRTHFSQVLRLAQYLGENILAALSKVNGEKPDWNEPLDDHAMSEYQRVLAQKLGTQTSVLED